MCYIAPFHVFDELQDGSCRFLSLGLCTKLLPPGCHDFWIPIGYFQDGVTDTRTKFNTYRAAKLEKVSATMLSGVSFTSMSLNARSLSVRSGSLFFHESYKRGSVCKLNGNYSHD